MFGMNRTSAYLAFMDNPMIKGSSSYGSGSVIYKGAWADYYKTLFSVFDFSSWTMGIKTYLINPMANWADMAAFVSKHGRLLDFPEERVAYFDGLTKWFTRTNYIKHGKQFQQENLTCVFHSMYFVAQNLGSKSITATSISDKLAELTSSDKGHIWKMGFSGSDDDLGRLIGSFFEFEYISPVEGLGGKGFMDHIKEAINNGYAVLASIPNPKGPGAHMITIIGYQNNEMLRVYNTINAWSGRNKNEPGELIPLYRLYQGLYIIKDIK